MRTIVFLLLVTLIAVGFGRLYLLENLNNRANSTPSQPAAVDPCACEANTPAYARRQSCDVTACHGAIEPALNSTAITRNEYRVWFDSDPHANAARVLGNSDSQRMVRLLAGESPPPGKYQEIYRRCFACHNTTIADAPGKLIEDMAFFDQKPEYQGVGCQACHGPASEWESIHYFACWKDLPSQKKRELGLRDTKTLKGRAELCAGCHVGGAERDVDHDLIAAGHPQMKFEMLGYHTLMPHHWNNGRDRERHPAFEAELWAQGQMASAKASLSLLESRAAKHSADRATAWPEFSEYDCFACHHDLQGSTWRSERGFTKAGKQVMLPWGVWHFAVLPLLATEDQTPEGQAFSQAYQQLKTTMESSFSPNPQQVQTQAAEVERALEQWQDHLQDPQWASRIQKLLRERGANKLEIASWDEAVQLYLAAYAVLESEKSPRQTDPPPWASKLKELQGDLGFPDGYHSPRQFPQSRDSSEDVPQQLQDFLKNLPVR